ncbi:E3 ubiquitin-protein ligase ATL41-like [Juglans microcarpa x Juglans regia]|uniref:E3 ubiquitin-protein ligase ATL41-like n=1 Tax=Juglans microcarpa x Juglans regia TaxID=2249226 RepID=UPI001B7E89B9|nr:E3 ubiquitin-protein ligase ATL41-like [Juglans microcarpa x Juglans regia]
MSSTNYDPFHALDNHDQGPPPLLNPDNRYRLNGKMMITAIVSLSVVIVLVIALHIYARCVLRRQARHQDALLQLGLSVARARSGEQQPRRGLDPAVIASLPVFVFKQRDVEVIDTSSTAMECAVCLSTLESEDMARLLPNCKHIFHAECIDKWLSSHSTCPICRCEAMPEVHPESREAPAGLAGLETASPTAPPSGFANSGLSSRMAAGTSDGAGQSSDQKIIGGSTSSRLNSFKRILSRDRSSARIHSSGIDQDDDSTVVDLEIRQ